LSTPLASWSDPCNRSWHTPCTAGPGPDPAGRDQFHPAHLHLAQALQQPPRQQVRATSPPPRPVASCARRVTPTTTMLHTHDRRRPRTHTHTQASDGGGEAAVAGVEPSADPRHQRVR
jgi:hypothetical protein